MKMLGTVLSFFLFLSMSVCAMEKSFHKEEDTVFNDTLNDTPLFVAISKGNLALVQEIVAEGASLYKRGWSGENPLLHAVYWSHPEIVTWLLLQQGVDVNERDRHGVTALMEAAARGNVQIVQALLTAGAKVNTESLIIVNIEPLIIAAGNGKKEIVQMLLDAGAKINGRDYAGCTALMSAANWGREDIVQLLVERGADVNAVDSRGFSVLAFAFPQNPYTCAILGCLVGLKELTIPPVAEKTRIARYLIKRGADREKTLKLLRCSQEHNEAVVFFESLQM